MQPSAILDEVPAGRINPRAWFDFESELGRINEVQWSKDQLRALNRAFPIEG
jgi:hypothetical protein